MRKKDLLICSQNLRDINPVQCGWEECDSGHTFGPAVRDHYLLHYVMDGKGTFESHGQTYRLSKGNLFLIRPDEVTVYSADSKEPWKYLWLGFGGVFAQPLVRNLPDALYCPQLGHLFEEIKQCHLSQGNLELYLCGKIYEIFSTLAQTYADQEKASLSYADLARSYILANYMNPITVEGLADILGIDRRYFSWVFSKEVGCAPKQYLLEVRMEKARQLLVQTDLAVQAVANSVGYTDAFQFSKMFKKHFRVAPLYFRQMRQSGQFCG